MSRLSRLRCTAGRIHPVDKGLMLFMVVLLAQSACNILFPSSAGQPTGDIDIIVRTSCAAIFGYLLSANFMRHTAPTGHSPTGQAPHILETGTAPTSGEAAPMAKIGFSAGDTQPGLEAAQPQTGGAQADGQASNQDSPAVTCLQIRVATAIGLFCLITLLILRNLSHWGILPAQSDTVVATVAQFRDFVSGCVGFLIGSPTQQQTNQIP